MKGKWISCLCIIVILGLSLTFSTNAYEINEKHSITVIVPGLTVNDFYYMMERGKLWNHASVAAMNRSTGGKKTSFNELLTIANGRLKAATEAETREIKKMKTLTSQENEYFLSHVVKDNYDDYVLGERLKRNNVHSSFTGHSHMHKEKYLAAPFLVTDREGHVIGNCNISVDKVESAPGGYRMNREKTFEWIKSVQSVYPSTWIVVEWGDLYRLKKSVPPSEKLTSKTLNELAMFIKQFNKGQTIYLIGIDPQVEGRREAAVPIIKWEAHSPIKGRDLVSPTVQQPFLSSSVDVAPTILQHYNIKAPSVWQGGALKNGNERENLESAFKKQIDGTTHIYKTRASVISVYITILVLLLLIGFVYWKRKKAINSHASALMKVLLVAGMVSPLSFIVAAGIFGRDLTIVPVYSGTVIVFSLGLAALLIRYGKRKAGWVISCLLLVVISADLVEGAPLMKHSYLGYDPLIGARYGGIGNELGGFFTAAAVVFLEPWVKRQETVKIWTVAFLFLMILGSSYLGKNAGVTLATGFMFFVLACLLYGKRWKGSVRHWSAVLVVLPGLFAVLWLLQQGGSTSHISYAFQLLFQGEWGDLWSIISRKIETNVRIILHSNWTKLLITSYILAFTYMIFERSSVLSVSQTIVLKAGGYGSLFLLLLNDSGAVAASTSMFYLLAVRYLWIFQGIK